MAISPYHQRQKWQEKMKIATETKTEKQDILSVKTDLKWLTRTVKPKLHLTQRSGIPDFDEVLD